MTNKRSLLQAHLGFNFTVVGSGSDGAFVGRYSIHIDEEKKMLTGEAKGPFPNEQAALDAAIKAARERIEGLAGGNVVGNP